MGTIISKIQARHTGLIFAIGTNAARAVGTNPIQGHLWQNFSSVTFKELPVPGTMILENPFNPKTPIQFKMANGGYYRTPSLINVWATAPLNRSRSVQRSAPRPHHPGTRGFFC